MRFACQSIETSFKCLPIRLVNFVIEPEEYRVYMHFDLNHSVLPTYRSSLDFYLFARPFRKTCLAQPVDETCDVVLHKKNTSLLDERY
jgi:hypothetical protein